MKTIILSDCHGQPHLITNVLDHANRWDRLIFLGDILDIGNRALDCFDILKENGAELIWGNHDLAVILNKTIWPQSIYDMEARNAIIDNKDKFLVSTYINDILLTHAGLSEYFYNNYFDNKINSVPEISNYLNTLPLKDLWQDQSPLWYRPSSHYKPKTGIRQIVGHTPPGWIKYNNVVLNNFLSVDPYCKKGFDLNRYRYVKIENGIIELFDSNGV